MSLAIATALISALAGLSGVAIGGWITAHNQRKQRDHERLREQLNEFYAPMLGIRSWILAKSQRRVRVSGAVDRAWRQLVERRQSNIEALQRLSQERMPDFEKIIEEDNREFVEDIMPRYREMVDLFRTRMALAEPDTLEHFGALVEFVDLWDRWLARMIPPEVVSDLGHSEEKLQPLYENLVQKFEHLKAKLKS